MAKAPYILLVDDEEDFLAVMQDALKAAGFFTKTVRSGDEAVASVEAKKPDLILMDVQMPKKDGIETMTEIHGQKGCKDLKIVFLTNFGEIGPYIAGVNRYFAKQIGALDYIKKGADMDALISKIKNILKNDEQ